MLTLFPFSSLYSVALGLLPLGVVSLIIEYSNFVLIASRGPIEAPPVESHFGALVGVVRVCDAILENESE